ncbi:MAG TPA: adenylate/guanylate cyclase domain-containing protein [Mycobacteriales bacterium]|nr:adenylate/guanylate cyclase domain-containing protein [Mycobacteriales bacterium]
MRARPRRSSVRTVVLLMTDVVGSTRLWAAEHEAMSAAMARHHEIVHRLVAEYGGWRPTDQGEGDSVFAAFSLATAAVSCAAAVQRTLAEQQWPTSTPLTVRIGMHVGEVEERAGNLLGDAVNRCARLRALGSGGQTLLTSALRGLVRDHLAEGLDVVDLGEHRMKDLSRPERVWQLSGEGLAGPFAPLASLGRVRHNLPVQTSTFIGRERELADIVASVRAHRLVTLTGFGGMGKTRLALQAAAELTDGAVGDVWLVELAAVDDPELVRARIAEALGIRWDARDPGEALVEALRETPTLLVLDNLEQVLGCAGFVADLLARSPAVRVLATSREPLHVRGERQMPIPPLGLPSGEVPTESLAMVEAVRLFADRAVAVRPDFVVDDVTGPAVAAVCARLEGHPLALELAAARVAMLSPARLLERLEQSLGVLTGAEHDRPERQRTVRATVAWSYDLLLPEEQVLLNRLSVFQGTAGLDAVEAVCATAAEEPSFEVFPVLASLVDKSLVSRSEEDGEARFSLLGSVRDFATEQLTPTARQALADAHLEFYLARSVAGAVTSDGAQEQPWYDELLRDAHNFRAALAHAESSGLAEKHLLLAANLYDWWYLGGHRVEGRDQLARALAAAGEPAADASLVAFATCALTLLTVNADADVSLAQRAVDVAERCSDPAVMGFAYQVQASRISERTAVRAALERAVDLARAARSTCVPIRWGFTGPDAVEFGAGFTLARFLDRWDDPSRARQLVRELQLRAADAGRAGDVAYCDLGLGEFAADVGDVPVATAHLDRAIEGLHRRHDEVWGAIAVVDLASVRIRAGLVPVEVLEPLIFRYRDVSPFAVASAQVLLGDVRAAAGDGAAAAAAYRDAIALSVRGTQPEPRWRLLRLDRLTGRDTRDDLEALYARRKPSLWPRPDLLGCLVEAAMTAEQLGLPDRAALLTATVRGMRGDLLLPELIRTDLVELEQRYGDESPRTERPEELFAG